MELSPETFSLTKAIEEITSTVSPLAKKKNIRVSRVISPPLEQVTLDQQRFKQVLYNLLSNAVKFTEVGNVDILVDALDANRFRIRVKDTGIGIKPENMNRLFKEFEQLDSGTSRKYGGTGLGLSLTRRIVELLEGDITVESEDGKGSTFTVVLPQTIVAGAK
ncbi:MAG: ATP-binding protein [candidate division NC10 bacterium]|nr:ATP-binding protein [candidate division NC10 bacterium]